MGNGHSLVACQASFDPGLGFGPSRVGSRYLEKKATPRLEESVQVILECS